MLRKSAKWTLIYLLEAVAALLALTIFAIGFLLWRLSSGPVELEFLREDAQAMLATAFEGEVVALGSLQARFEPSTRAIVLVATDVTVAEDNTQLGVLDGGVSLSELVDGLNALRRLIEFGCGRCRIRGFWPRVGGG